MNSKNVLKKLVNLLSAEIKFMTAQLVDGTIVESDDFAVGSEIFIVSEEGREPAPDGTHEAIIDDVPFTVVTEGGLIVSAEPQEVEVEEELAEVTEEESEEIKEAVKDAVEGDLPEEVAEAVAEEVVDAVEEIDSAEMMKKMEEMSYRIEELEKKYDEMMKEKEDMEEEEKKEEEELEKELPQLDGAPTEMSSHRNNKKVKGTNSAQNTFLSRLYK